MKNLQTHITNYLNYCHEQRRLDEKTLKAYRIDLHQFSENICTENAAHISTHLLEGFIAELHKQYKPKTVKRKISSVKAFFHYLEYKEVIEHNPFNKLQQIRFREPVILPKTIPLKTVELILFTIYFYQKNAQTTYQKRNALRDAAVIELLFATGIRISELCNLKENDIDLYDGTILIHGKGKKERCIQVGSEYVVRILNEYRNNFYDEIKKSNYFFANQSGRCLSDQSVRRMICKYSFLAGIDIHITPHMFRHTFATSLLDADVDIRYIQEMLGHSSINITEIYTHVSVAKQRDILKSKHPRNNFRIID